MLNLLNVQCQGVDAVKTEEQGVSNNAGTDECLKFFHAKDLPFRKGASPPSNGDGVHYFFTCEGAPRSLLRLLRIVWPAMRCELVIRKANGMPMTAYAHTTASTTLLLCAPYTLRVHDR